MPWACRILYKRHGSRPEGPSIGCCWPPEQAEQGQPVAGVVGRQHQALQRRGMDEQGWKHPSSLIFVEICLFQVSAWVLSALHRLLRDLVSLAGGSCLACFAPVQQQPPITKVACPRAES